MDPQPRLIAESPVHLGLGSTAVPLDGFAWDPEYLQAYEQRFAADGAEGRMITTFEMTGDWQMWEAHPAGDELVLCVTGRYRLHVEVDGEVSTVEIGPGEYVVNPPGAWHTADVIEPGTALFVTPGQGTTHRPR